MTARLFVLQRVSAAFLAFAVAIHLATILYASRHELTAGEILSRTHGNVSLLVFYSLLVVAVAVHAPIGLRNIAREWLGWRGPASDGALLAFALLLMGLGFRAVASVFFG
jgi:fumarate reductase subunit C